ncbi:MAG: hypothetical protein ACRCSG_07960 [Cellulosilyticaceae bacterium]
MKKNIFGMVILFCGSCMMLSLIIPMLGWITLVAIALIFVGYILMAG